MSDSFDKTKPVGTRAGLPAQIIEVPGGYKGPSGETVLALIKTDIGHQIRGFYEDGHYFRNQEGPWDLVNTELPPREYAARFFMIVFNDGSINVSSRAPLTEGEFDIIAKAEINPTFLETRPLSAQEQRTLTQAINRL